MHTHKLLRIFTLSLVLTGMLLASSSSEPAAAAGPWYVATGGNDSNDCLAPGTPCETINGAIGKATAGDTVYIAEGTYTGSGSQVILIDKDITLSGGWDPTFTTQDEYALIDGEDARRGITINWGLVVELDQLLIMNGSTGSSGGGINAGGGTLTIRESYIFDNYAYAGGGGITTSSASLTLFNSSVTNNYSPQWGGGIFGNCSDLYISNSTISENATDSGGGGILHGCDTEMKIHSSSIVGNTAISNEGGGIRTFTGASIQNSIVADNSSDQGGNDCWGTITSLGYNILSDSSDCTIAATTGDQFDTDPIVGPVVGYPGYNPISASSPTIDAGNPAGCTDHLGGSITIDQRGIARSGICDVGAYEYTVPDAAEEIFILSGSQQRSTPSEAFALPLQAMVIDNVGSPVDGLTATFTAPASGASAIFSDSASNVTTAVTDEFGVATSAVVTANSITGAYIVSATVPGVGSPAEFDLMNVLWYVSTAGNDGNDCLTTLTPCASVNAVLAKSGFAPNDVIYIGSSIFTSSSTEVALIDKDARLYGGWDASFSVQDGMSTLDGEDSRRGLKIGSGVTATMEHFIIENGYGFDGGGIFNEGILSLSDCSIRNSLAYDSYGEGGGIFNASSGELTLNTCEINGNSAYTGGGLYNDGGSVLINDSAIVGNTLTSGSSGGGIRSSGTLILNNSTVSGNVAGGGGGISGNATLNNTTITDNTGSSTGGLDGSAEMQNSIIAGNAAIWWPDCHGTVTTYGYNLIEDTAGCTFTPASGDQTGVDPELSPLIHSPGYHPIASTSPARDAGNPGSCAGSEGPLDADQRGASRVGNCDIGAYEYTVPGPADQVIVHAGSPQHTPPQNEFWSPLRALVLDSIGTPVNSVAVAFTAPPSGASGTFADSGTQTTSIVTNDYGVATSTAFTANGIEGGYIVEATTVGVPDPAEFNLANLGWYVTTGGSDGADCQSPATSCETISGALSKDDFLEGDTVLVAGGSYTGTGESVLTFAEDARVVGGWNDAFSVQDRVTMIDGEGARRGVEVQKYATVLLENLTIHNGYGTMYGGGGILNRGSVALNQCTVSENRSGGIINLHGMVTINDSAIIKNSASSGGGGITNGSMSLSLIDALTINNSTISANIASSDSGGIHNYGSAYINNSTISENYVRTSFSGGGIQNESSGTLTLQNTIVAGNVGDSNDCEGAISSSGYNLIGDTTGCTFASTTGDQTNIDPGLAALGDNGGPSPTHGLSAGSAAINAGNPAGCSDDLGSPLSTDQRGAPRVGICDIGAYEAGVTATKAVTGSFRPGSEVSVTLTLGSDEGTVDLTNVSLADDLPAAMTYVPGSYADNNGTGSESGGVITWNGTVYAATDTVITFRAVLDPGLPACSIVRNSALIDHDGYYEFEEQARIAVACQICSVSKHGSNPVFDTGTSGSWDETGVLHPTVVKAGSTYMMWYAGNDGVNPTRIGLATSSDGLTWTREASNPVLTPSASWEAAGVSRPSVLFNGLTYEMWYTGVDSGGVIQIGYATSSDGISWVKSSSNPVLAVGTSGSWDDEDVSGPTVVKVGYTYHMWYSGHDGSIFRIGHATSSNGITWSKDPGNPVYAGQVGDWDWMAAYSPEILRVGDAYQLWYSGESLQTDWQTGYAQSTDGASWTREGMMIPEGLPGTFDTNSADHPAVILDGDTYRFWYSGVDDGYTYTIGYAEGHLCPVSEFRLCLPLIMKDYTPGPTCPPDYVDDFSDPASGWLIYEDSDVKFDYTGGEYQIWVKNADSWWLITPGAKATDFTAAVSARRLSGTDGPYGLVFGISDDWSEYYEVIIDDAYYSIWRVSGGLTTLQGWTYSGDINTGIAWNRLKVIREGSNISVYINDVFQTTVSDSALLGWRRIGLLAASPLSVSMDFRFDDFALYPASCGPIAADVSGLEWGEAEAHEGIIPPRVEEME